MTATETRRKTCDGCASSGKLTWLPCAEHHLVIPTELCGHEHSSVIFIHNGVGVSCHDCGNQVTDSV
jgi:hypothetical protein